MIVDDKPDNGTGNILPSSAAAPSLLSHQKNLERHMRRDSLEKQIVNRPAPETLIKEGILQSRSRCELEWTWLTAHSK